MKKFLALILSVALVLSFLPIVPAMATSDTSFAYAEELGVEVGETLVNHDYSTMSSLPAEITGRSSFPYPDPVTGGNAIYFGNIYDDSLRNARIDVGTENFAAKVTMIVDNVQANKIAGMVGLNCIGKNAGGEEATASYIKFGLPDRVQEPNAGDAIYYDESISWGYSVARGVSPFTATSGIETFTFYMYSLNGVSYYVDEDNNVIATSVHKTGVTDATVVEMFGTYSVAYVTDFVVKELLSDEVISPATDFGYAESINAEIGDTLVNHDYSTIATKPAEITGNAPYGYKDPVNSGNAIYFGNIYDDSLRNARIDVGTENFAAKVTMIVDNVQTNAIAGMFGLNCIGKNAGGEEATASYVKFGLPDRVQEPNAGDAIYYDESISWGYSVANDVTPFTADSGIETFTFYMYSLNGTCYYVDEDDNLIATSVHKTGVTDATIVEMFGTYSVVYVTDFVVKELSARAVQFENELIENSGFIADELVYDVDFKTVGAGTVPEGWTFSGANINIGSSESAGRNVLRLADDWGYTNASYAVPTNNFAAVATIGIDYAKALAGSLWFGVKDQSGTVAAGWALGLPKRAASQALKAGKSLITNNSAYKYPAAGDYTFNTQGYTTVKMVIYFYEGTFYAYWPDGTLVDSIQASGKADLSNGALIYFANDYATAYIHDLKVYEIIPNSFKVDSSFIAVSEENTPLMNFNFSFDDSNSDVISSDDLEFGAVVTVQDTAVTTETTVETSGAEIWNLEAGAGDENTVYFLKGIEIPAENIDAYYNIRTFVKSGDKYFYNPAVTYSPAKLADVFYRSSLDEGQKELINNFFENSNIYLGKESKKTTFTVFSDFHYMQGMYISSIANMNEIFDRAHASGSSFVLSAGDMTNDMKGSPELVNAFKTNKYGITAANVYGNHELETNNTMADVTPTLTNAENVVWGTADGTMDNSIGYYYFEKDGFRIICTDTNYSWNPTTESWEHNRQGSYNSPSGNTNVNALGPVQLEWLEDVLYDAAEKDIPCIVMSHATFKSTWTDKSNDAATVEALFDEVNSINPGTVMMHISGHAHDDRIEEQNGIVYFRVNTTRNGYWSENNTKHYFEDDTFMMETYDENGNFLGYEEKQIGELNGGTATHFLKDALSATVTIDECGIITIDGMETSWQNDIIPDLSSVDPHIRPQISSFSTFDCANGHVWAENYTVDGDVHYKECINPECTITDKTENAYYGEHDYADGECVCGYTGKPTVENGDVNGDGDVNAGDLALLKKIIAGLTPIDDPSVANPNVDDVPGLPNAADLALLKKMIARLV